MLAVVWLRGDGTPLTLAEICDELGEQMPAVSAAVSTLTNGTMYAYWLPKD